jgi:hypothetical protein
MSNVVQSNQFPMPIYSYLQQLQLHTSAKYKNLSDQYICWVSVEL